MAQIHSYALDDRCDIKQRKLRDALVHLEEQRQGLPNASSSTQHRYFLALHNRHDPSSCPGSNAPCGGAPCIHTNKFSISDIQLADLKSLVVRRTGLADTLLQLHCDHTRKFVEIGPGAGNTHGAESYGLQKGYTTGMVAPGRQAFGWSVI